MAISTARAQLAAATGEAILFGINVILFPITLWLLLSRKKMGTGTVALICLMVTMFSISTAHYVVITDYTFIDFLDRDMTGLPVIYTTSIFESRTPRVWLPVALEVANEVLGDTIVIWRAWAVWNRSYTAILAPFLFWVATIVSGIGSAYFLSRQTDYQSVEFSTDDSAGIWVISFLTSTFLTNLCTVGIIGYRYRMYHKDVVSVLGGRASTQQRFFLLIIESGSLYCATLIILAIVYVTESGAIYIMTQLVSQLTLIYPTLIIILHCLRCTKEIDIDDLYRLSYGHTPGFPSSTSALC